MTEFDKLHEIEFPKGAYLIHFSLDIPVTCIIQRDENNNLKVGCSREVANILNGDPVIIKFINNENEWILTGDVISILDSISLSILVTGAEKYENKREHKRYAVSLNAVVTGIDSMDYICSTIKNISSSGVSINCKYNYDVNSLLIVSIITSTINVIHFIAKAVRKSQVLDYYEYGLEISSIVSPNNEKLNEYIDSLEKAERSFLEQIKYN